MRRHHAPTGIRAAHPGLRLTSALAGLGAGELHRERLKSDRHRLDPLIRYRLTAAALTPAQWYLQAQRVRRMLKQQIDSLFATYDLLIAPATPFPARTIGTETVELGGETIPARSAAGIMTQPCLLYTSPSPRDA